MQTTPVNLWAQMSRLLAFTGRPSFLACDRQHQSNKGKSDGRKLLASIAAGFYGTDDPSDGQSTASKLKKPADKSLAALQQFLIH